MTPEHNSPAALWLMTNDLAAMRQLTLCAKINWYTTLSLYKTAPLFCWNSLFRSDLLFVVRVRCSKLLTTKKYTSRPLGLTVSGTEMKRMLILNLEVLLTVVSFYVAIPSTVSNSSFWIDLECLSYTIISFTTLCTVSQTLRCKVSCIFFRVPFFNMTIWSFV